MQKARDGSIITSGSSLEKESLTFAVPQTISGGIYSGMKQIIKMNLVIYLAC